MEADEVWVWLDIIIDVGVEEFVNLGYCCYVI
jgi:hypothetical protein